MSLIRETIAGLSVLRRPGEVRLVLLHGIGSDAETWAPLLHALDPAIDALAWDAPGYGTSAPLANPFPTPDDYADRLAALLDALGWDRVALAGHSLGCLFAARFALRHPGRVGALALLSPALGYGVAPGERLPPQVQARIDDLDALGPHEFAAKRAARLVHRPDDRPDIVAGVQRAMAAVHPGPYAQAVRALGAGTLLDDAGQLRMAVHIAIGAEDVVTPPDNARAVHAVLAHPGPLELVPDCGHALPQQAPARIAAFLAAMTQEAAIV